MSVSKRGKFLVPKKRRSQNEITFPTPKKRRRGAPTKFKQEYIQQAYIACSELGAKQSQLAQLFGVNPQTIDKWTKQHEQFANALKKGRDEYDSHKVERCLLDRALGFYVDESYEEYVRLLRKVDRDNPAIKVPAKKVKKYKKFVPGDVSAMFFWLQNRQPNRWRNTKYIQVDRREEKQLTLRLEKVQELKSNLSREELEQLQRILKKTNEGTNTTTTEPGLSEPGVVRALPSSLH